VEGLLLVSRKKIKAARKTHFQKGIVPSCVSGTCASCPEGCKTAAPTPEEALLLEPVQVELERLKSSLHLVLHVPSKSVRVQITPDFALRFPTIEWLLRVLRLLPDGAGYVAVYEALEWICNPLEAHARWVPHMDGPAAEDSVLDESIQDELFQLAGEMQNVDF
jgi:hypothetical protein